MLTLFTEYLFVHSAEFVITIVQSYYQAQHTNELISEVIITFCLV